MLRYVFTLLLVGIFCCLLAQPVSKPADKFALFFEKAYLHTDRELYLSGEDIWLKAYLVNAQTNHPFSSSNNLYVELISPGAAIISRHVIRMDNSMGKGDIKLADTLSAGTYTLRAYTNWMRNFGDNFVFQKTIRIAKEVEPIKPIIAKKKAPTKTNIKNTTPLTPNAPRIRFYPEGGSLVEGIPSRVAFKIEGPDGKGISAKGSILSSTGDTLTTFISTSSGMGSFSLKPQAGEKYTASGSLAGKQAFLAQLPQALQSGYTLYVQEKDSLINVMTFLNDVVLNTEYNKSLVLAIKQGGKTVIATPVAVTSGQLITRISKQDLPSGINAITLYDSQKRPQCERLIFIPEREQVNLSISPDKASYKSKEKVTLSIKASDSKGNPVKTHLSLAITDAGIIPENEGDIRSYLQLQSEIRGKIENPKQYFDESNPERQKQLELLLLTQGWRDFVWKRVADSTIRISKVLEQGITISGRASETGKNKPLIKANISLRTPNAKGIKFHSTQTDSLGRFYIDRLELYGTQGIKLAAMNNKGEPYGRLTMDSVFNDTLKVRPPLLKPESEELEEAKSNTLLAERLLNRKKTYKLSDTIQLAEVKIKQKMKPMVLMSTVVLMDFGYPEENFTVTTKDHDYQSLLHYLLTKSGYSTSQIRGLRLTRGELYFKTGTMPLSEVRPLIIINGRIVYDPYYKISRISEGGVVENEEESDDDIFASMSMDMIEKINIKKIVVTPGTDIGFILDITTKPGALDWKQRDKVIALINGYYQSRTFYSPLYEKPVTTPDNRHTIFWQPFLATNEKGEASVTYYNADPQGKIRIAVEGLGEKGGIVVGRGSYEVK